MGLSKLTQFPDRRVLKLVIFMVSCPKSKRSAEAEFSLTVRQIPLTATLSPLLAFQGFKARMTSRAPVFSRTLPFCSTIPWNMGLPGFERYFSFLGGATEIEERPEKAIRVPRGSEDNGISELAGAKGREPQGLF